MAQLGPTIAASSTSEASTSTFTDPVFDSVASTTTASNSSYATVVQRGYPYQPSMKSSVQHDNAPPLSAALLGAPSPSFNDGSSILFSDNVTIRTLGIGFPMREGVPLERYMHLLADLVDPRHVSHAATRLSEAVVYFKHLSQVNTVLQQGITLDGERVPLYSLDTIVRKVTISNIMPEIPNDFIVSNLHRYGKVRSPLRDVPAPFKDPRFRHILSLKRTVFMAFRTQKEIDAMPRRVNFLHSGRRYQIYLTLGTECFNCLGSGHLRKNCPNPRVTTPFVQFESTLVKSSLVSSISSTPSFSAPSVSVLTVSSLPPSTVASESPTSDIGSSFSAPAVKGCNPPLPVSVDPSLLSPVVHDITVDNSSLSSLPPKKKPCSSSPSIPSSVLSKVGSSLSISDSVIPPSSVTQDDQDGLQGTVPDDRVSMFPAAIPVSLPLTAVFPDTAEVDSENMDVTLSSDTVQDSDSCAADLLRQDYNMPLKQLVERRRKVPWFNYIEGPWTEAAIYRFLDLTRRFGSDFPPYVHMPHLESLLSQFVAITQALDYTKCRDDAHSVKVARVYNDTLKGITDHVHEWRSMN